MTTPQKHLADVIRDVTVAMQQAIDSGQRSREINADDLIEILLSVADRLDPPMSEDPEWIDCANCGANDWEEINPDHCQIRCLKCGHNEFG